MEPLYVMITSLDGLIVLCDFDAGQISKWRSEERVPLSRVFEVGDNYTLWRRGGCRSDKGCIGRAWTKGSGKGD